MRRRGLAFFLSLALLMTVAATGVLAADTAVLEVKSDLKDTTATAVLDSERLLETVEQALESSVPAATVRVETSSRADSLSLTIPTEDLSSLGARKNAKLTITSDIVELTLDADAVAAVVNQTGGADAVLTVRPVAVSQLNENQRQAVGNVPVFDLALVSGGRDLYTFGGGVVTVTLPYQLPKGQEPAGVTVWFLDTYGNTSACETDYDADAQQVTFSTRHFSCYAIGYQKPLEQAFTDVPASYWAYGEIAWAYEQGLMTGRTATTFQPDATMTRQQVWMILARLSGAVPADMEEAKVWAVKSGISDGSAPGTAVTRQQLVSLLYRYAELMGYPVTGKADLSGYPDAGRISGYATAPMAWAVGNNVISGTVEGYLAPGATATRAQFAVILWRFWDASV